jgi:glycosyltransferase involved in cell wall biosynthesis
MTDAGNSTRAPFLSITVLNYNYAHFLPACLDSILRQTMTDFELIVINDRSTDNSLEVIEPYLRDPRVKLVDHVQNKGFVGSLVEGCALSRGQYISVISADDLAMDDRAFEYARAVCERNPDVALCFSAWYEVTGEQKIRYERRAATESYVREGIDELRRLLISSSVLHSGTWIKRTAYHQVGGYDRSCRYAVDNNMWLALCSAGKVAYIDKHLYAYRAHEVNMSNSAPALWQTTQEMLKGIDYALGLVPDSSMPDKSVQRRMARKRALVAVPTHDIFAGRYRRGWYGYLQAATHFPVDTLVQPRTLTVLLRTLVGKRPFEIIRSLRGERNSLGRSIP